MTCDTAFDTTAVVESTSCARPLLVAVFHNDILRTATYYVLRSWYELQVKVQWIERRCGGYVS